MSGKELLDQSRSAGEGRACGRLVGGSLPWAVAGPPSHWILSNRGLLQNCRQLRGLTSPCSKFLQPSPFNPYRSH